LQEEERRIERSATEAQNAVAADRKKLEEQFARDDAAAAASAAAAATPAPTPVPAAAAAVATAPAPGAENSTSSSAAPATPIRLRLDDAKTPESSPSTRHGLSAQKTRRGFLPGSAHPSSSPRPAKFGSVTFRDRGRIIDAVAQVFDSRSTGGWVLVNYTGKEDLDLAGSSDSDDIATLYDHLNDDHVQYAIVRVKHTGGDDEQRTKDVFVCWIGAAVKTIEKGRKKSHLGDVQQLLQPFHNTVFAVRKQALTPERLFSAGNQTVLE